MRTLTTLFILFIFLNGKSQDVFPDATDNQYWEYVTWNFWGGACEKRIIKAGSEVNFCDDNVIEIFDCDENMNNCNLISYYRVLGDSVMIRNSTDCNEPEILMYDFSILSFDTLAITYEFWKTNEQNIDYEGTLRKTLYMEYYPYPNLPIPPYPIYQMNWIEGIGSNVHPFYPLTCIGDHCEMEQQLVRVVKNNIVIYLDTVLTFSYPCTGWINEIEEVKKDNILIYPNPFESSVTVSFQNDLAYKDVILSIIDIYGKTLLKTMTSTRLANMDIRNLSSGIYFLEIQLGEKKIIRKIIKKESH